MRKKYKFCPRGQNILKYPHNQSGVALIICVGILAILTFIGVAFAISSIAEYKNSASCLNGIKAKYLAEAGIARVIADMRSWVAAQDYGTLIANIGNYTTNYPGEQSAVSVGTYEINSIEKETQNTGGDGKVNINTLNRTDSDWIQRLFGSLAGVGISERFDTIARIIDYRDADSSVTTSLYWGGGIWQNCTGDETGAANSPYATIEEARLAIGDTKYEKIKNVITVYGPIIRGGLLAEYYADKNFSNASFRGKIVELGEIRELGMQGADGPNFGYDESHAAEFAGTYLLPTGRPGDWNTVNPAPNNFGVTWYGYIYIEPGEVGNIIFRLRSDDGSRLYINDTLVVNYWWDHGLGVASNSYNFTRPGWHRLKLQYYEVSNENGCELRWKGSDWNSAGYVPAERLGFDPPANAAYNAAGYYKITATGRAKNGSSTIAKKRLSAIVKVFDTWTQTQRSEFYQPWFSVYGNETDGEMKNVTWLNSCPTSEGTTRDSLKLGFWDDFDEDLGYTWVNLYNSGEISGIGDYYNPGGNTDYDHELVMSSQNKDDEGRNITLNSSYYYSSNTTSRDVYAEVWERDYASPYWDVRDAGSSDAIAEKYDSSGNKTAQLYAKSGGNEIWTDLKTWKDTGKCSELVSNILSSYASKLELANYAREKTLGIDGRVSGFNIFYRGYLDGVLKIDDWERGQVTDGYVKLKSYTHRQGGYLDSDPQNQAWLTTYWDNLRVIHGTGYLISTPFYTGGNVNWGTISWSSLMPGASNVTVETRTANTKAGLAGAGWAGAANGGGVPSGNNLWIQYKATLTTAISGPSTPTPVLKDVTIIYLPAVEVLLCREIE